MYSEWGDTEVIYYKSSAACVVVYLQESCLTMWMHAPDSHDRSRIFRYHFQPIKPACLSGRIRYAECIANLLQEKSKVKHSCLGLNCLLSLRKQQNNKLVTWITDLLNWTRVKGGLFCLNQFQRQNWFWMSHGMTLIYVSMSMLSTRLWLQKLCHLFDVITWYPV